MSPEIIFGSLFVLAIVGGIVADKAKLAAKQKAYQDALYRLQMETTKANKIAALNAGRDLAAHCRKKGKVAIFDEVALQNDLRAYGD